MDASLAPWITEWSTGPHSKKSDLVKGPQLLCSALWSGTLEKQARGQPSPRSALSCASLPRVSHEMETRGSFENSRSDILQLWLSSKRPARGIGRGQEASQSVPSVCLTWASL